MADVSIAGEVLATLTSMASTTKAVLEAVKTAKAKTKSSDTEQALSLAVDQIHSLQSSLFDAKEKALSIKAETLNLHAENLQLREENAKLRSEIAQLNEDIRRNDQGLTEREKYQPKQVGSAVVLVHSDTPGIFYCTACFETKGKAVPLNRLGKGPFSILGSY